jgi:hypothetical protein
VKNSLAASVSHLALSVSPTCKALLIATLGISVIASSAYAIEPFIPIPAPTQSSDMFDVDLLSGATYHSIPAISIGTGANTLTRSQSFNLQEPRDSFGGKTTGGPYSHTVSGAITGATIFNYIGHSAIFGDEGNKIISCAGTGAPKTCVNSDQALTTDYSTKITEYTDRDGNLVVFDGNYTEHSGPGLSIQQSAYLTEVKQPDGVIYRIYLQNSGVTGVAPRVKSVVTNYGYMLKYEYASDTSSDIGFSLLTKITPLNLSTTYCGPYDSSCDTTGYPDWTFVTHFSTTSNPGVNTFVDLTATDPLGGATFVNPLKKVLPSGRQIVRSGSYNAENVGSGWELHHTYAGYTSNIDTFDPVTFELDTQSGYRPCGADNSVFVVCVSGKFDVAYGGNTWQYDFIPESMDVNSQSTTTITNPLSGVRTVKSGVPASQNYFGDYTAYAARVITEVKDELNRTTSYQYNDQNSTNLTRIVYPEGNYSNFTYDSRHNVIERRDVAKSGSGIADVVWTAGFDSTCSNSVTCNKPNYTIDPNGNRTDFTYDSVHGGVLTVTGPANPSGVHSQTRNTYTAIYAKVRDASGALVNAEAPIYKLTASSMCRSATASDPASCVGTVNELVTVYAYDSNNLLLTSVTTKDGDNSLSATTSYGYDAMGNQIWVDGPRTDVDDKSYTTYDALRRPVFEIGPDPDGSGSAKRAMTHHVYDADSNEIRTETGAGNGTDGSDFAVSSFRRMTYDDGGRLVKTEMVQP